MFLKGVNGYYPRTKINYMAGTEEINPAISIRKNQTEATPKRKNFCFDQSFHSFKAHAHVS